jgi:hypothetical protein
VHSAPHRIVGRMNDTAGSSSGTFQHFYETATGQASNIAGAVMRMVVITAGLAAVMGFGLYKHSAAWYRARKAELRALGKYNALCMAGASLRKRNAAHTKSQATWATRMQIETRDLKTYGQSS